MGVVELLEDLDLVEQLVLGDVGARVDGGLFGHSVAPRRMLFHQVQFVRVRGVRLQGL